MKKEFSITLLRNHADLTVLAANWFHEKWNVPLDAYLDSIKECQKNQHKVPQWYLMMHKKKIIAGLGVIENDFHNRKDLTPNICALFVEKQYRNMGLAKTLLDFACRDLSSMGYRDAYLITDHTSFYEKCGWHFLCMVEENNGNMARMYHISLR